MRVLFVYTNINGFHYDNWKNDKLQALLESALVSSKPKEKEKDDNQFEF